MWRLNGAAYHPSQEVLPCDQIDLMWFSRLPQEQQEAVESSGKDLYMEWPQYQDENVLTTAGEPASWTRSHLVNVTATMTISVILHNLHREKSLPHL